MTQELIAGILLCAIGLVMSSKPKLVWNITEKWKSNAADEPSRAFILVIRVVSGVLLGVGIVLISNVNQ